MVRPIHSAQAFRAECSYQLPAEGFACIYQIVGDKRRGIPPIIPESRSSFLAKVKAGIYPRPVKLGGCTAWRVADIRALIASLGKEGKQ